jgi:hypothetical protein
MYIRTSLRDQFVPMRDQFVAIRNRGSEPPERCNHNLLHRASTYVPVDRLASITRLAADAQASDVEVVRAAGLEGDVVFDYTR